MGLLAVGMLQGLAVQHALGSKAPPGLVWMFAAGATGAFLCLPVVTWTVRRAHGLSRMKAVLLHAAAASLFSVIGIAIARALAILMGAPASQVPPLLELVMFELQNTLPLYAGLAFAYATYAALQRRRAAERDAASLREQLIDEQVRAASARLQPARVYAALHAAREALPHRAAECDAHIQALADALRSPRHPHEQAALPALDVLAGDAPSAREPTVHGAAWPRYLLAFPVIAGGALLLGRAMAFALPAQSDLFYVGSLGRAVGAWLALPVAYAAARLAHGRSKGTQLAVYASGFLAFSVVWVSAAACTRSWLCDGFGLALPKLSWREGLLLEAQRLSFAYAAFCGAGAAWRAVRDGHARERWREQLRGALAESRLAALNARVDPHFLFNALNTLSSLASNDPERTAHLIDALRELLEVALSSHEPDWPLSDEQRYTQRFIEFLGARFGTRVCVELMLPEALLEVRVPRMSLQTLVENAVKHNQDRRKPLHVQLSARATANATVLTVNDDGKGFSLTRPHAHARGGLERLRHTLQLLYGSGAALVTGMSEGQGARIEMSIPRIPQIAC
ncbi:MAG: histidine kinase [Myxococcales bacterium]